MGRGDNKKTFRRFDGSNGLCAILTEKCTPFGNFFLPRIHSPTDISDSAIVTFMIPPITTLTAPRTRRRLQSPQPPRQPTRHIVKGRESGLGWHRGRRGSERECWRVLGGKLQDSKSCRTRHMCVQHRRDNLRVLKEDFIFIRANIKLLTVTSIDCQFSDN